MSNADISWDNITADDAKERNVEMYLWQVDIGLELNNPLYNPEAAKLVIKKAIFECMQKYKSNGVQARIFQLLQDIFLFTKGDISDEELESNFEHILDALKNAISYPDVASSALELLSMLATKTFTKRKYYDSDAFQSSIINLITSQSNNKVVVRAGMTFFVEICKASGSNENDITTSSFSFSVAEKILTCMLQNVSIYPDDALFFSCYRFIDEFLDKAPKTPNNHTTISKSHTNIIVDIVLVAISSSESNAEVLLLSFQCLNRLKLETEHINKINKGPRGIIIYLDFMDANPNLTNDALYHLELIVQGLTHLDVYDSNMSMEIITEFRDLFVNKIKELEGDFDSVEKIYNYYIEVTTLLNKILPSQSQNEKESTDVLSSKLNSARESPTKEGPSLSTDHVDDDNNPIQNLEKEKAEMAIKIEEMTTQLDRVFSEMDGLRKSNIEMYNKMFSAVSELIDTKKELEAKQYEYEEGKRIIKDMITLTTLSQKQAVLAIEESDNMKILYKNVKEENELLRQMLENEAQDMDTFPNLANSEIIRYPDSPQDKNYNNITSEKDETNDNEDKCEKAPLEGMVSLTIVGIKEALRDHDTLLKKNYHHKESNLNINLIRSDKGLSVPLTFESNITVSTTTTLDTTIDTLARITRLVYKSFKKGSFCGNEKVNHTTMSTQTFRYSLKELGLITTAHNSKLCTLTDLDMIIVRLGIFQKISIFGFIYVAILLALKNESNNNRGDTNNEIVLQKVIDIFESYLNKQKNIDGTNMSINISDDESIRVNKLFDDEKLSLKHLFLSYLPNVPRLGYDESKDLVPTTSEGGFGLSLEIIVQFCRDFNLTPALVNTGTIIQIFEHILSTGFVSGHGEPLLNWIQFRSFLLHISMKCSYFEDYHGRDRIERRLYNLFYYLDHSSGFESISSRDRSIAIIRFKLIYAREDARINKELQLSMKKKNDFMKDNIALKRVKSYKPM